jgi:hypothetical protein
MRSGNRKDMKSHTEKFHLNLHLTSLGKAVTVGAGDRATEFKQRCRQLGIKGVTLHSYRYA